MALPTRARTVSAVRPSGQDLLEPVLAPRRRPDERVPHDLSDAGRSVAEPEPAVGRPRRVVRREQRPDHQLRAAALQRQAQHLAPDALRRHDRPAVRRHQRTAHARRRPGSASGASASSGCRTRRDAPSRAHHRVHQRLAVGHERQVPLRRAGAAAAQSGRQDGEPRRRKLGPRPEQGPGGERAGEPGHDPAEPTSAADLEAAAAGPRR